MNQSTENDLLSISLTPFGSIYLLRSYRLAKVIFILAILVTLIFLADGWIQHKINTRNYAGLNLDWVSWFSVNVHLIYSVIMATITMVQIYFFFYFAQQCKAAIRQQQTDLFNASFKWLYRNTVLACILFILQLIFRGFFLAGQYWVWQNWRPK
jgi:hypothetical protein